MSLTSAGLSNLQGLGVGQTTNFIVQYENTLPNQANVIANADALLPVLETESRSRPVGSTRRAASSAPDSNRSST